jgi:hypothetical protein
VADRSWLKIQPDKHYLIAEERLRFPVAADLEPAMVPYALFSDLKKAVEIFEKHRGWRLLDAVPRRKEFPGGIPCCMDIMAKKAGESLTIKFMPSDFQGDTDDAHNFGETSDPNKRMFEENIIDWVAIMHFWVPGQVVDMGAEADYSKSLNRTDGFAPLDLLPKGAVPKITKRLNKNV